jgi:hypothetical protein
LSSLQRVFFLCLENPHHPPIHPSHWKAKPRESPLVSKSRKPKESGEKKKKQQQQQQQVLETPTQQLIPKTTNNSSSSSSSK